MQTDSQATTLSPDDPGGDPEFFHLVLEKVRSKGMKYSAVSVVNVIVGQGLILFFHGIMHWGASRSNVAAVLLSAVPAYYLNRIWVWGVRGRSNWKTEVLPFWIFVAIGLVMSTAAVALASQVSNNRLVPNLASIGAFGILWVLRFFVLDKMFHTPHADLYEVVEELVEEHEHHADAHEG